MSDSRINWDSSFYNSHTHSSRRKALIDALRNGVVSVNPTLSSSLPDQSSDSELLQCSHCRYTTLNSTILSNHISTWHSHGNGFKCLESFCSKICSSLESLADHIGTTHCRYRKNCPGCEGSFVPNYFRQHLSRNKSKKFTCEQCKESFHHGSIWKSHTLICQPLHTCLGCDKVFHSNFKLQKHLSKEHLSRSKFFCYHITCGLEFVHGPLWKEHLLLHPQVRIIPGDEIMTYLGVPHIFGQSIDKLLSCEEKINYIGSHLIISTSSNNSSSIEQIDTIENTSGSSLTSSINDNVLAPSFILPTDTSRLNDGNWKLIGSSPCPFRDCGFAGVVKDIEDHLIYAHGFFSKETRYFLIYISLLPKYERLQRFSCPFENCNAVYFRKTVLKDHQIWKHSSSTTIESSSSLSSNSDSSHTIYDPLSFLPKSSRPRAGIKNSSRTWAIPSNPSRFTCQTCSTIFFTREDRENHKHTSHPLLFPIKCDFCVYYCSLSDMSSHVLRQHSSNAIAGRIHSQSWKCAACNRRFPTSADKEAHKHLIHSDIYPLKCPWCLYFSSRSTMKDHTLSIHNRTFSLDI